MRTTGILVVFLLCMGSVSAIEVDVNELESTVTDTINFINYTGAQTGSIDTIESIRSIGESLSVVINSGESTVYAQKYRVTHILPSDDGLRGADLFELLPASRVDHIDNLRRIISAYLESRYGYSSEDALLLGKLVTIYNAVHRGNLDIFTSRYTVGLHSLLDEKSAGLSLTYSEWPGSSQIIIPIASDAAVGELSSVPADELLDETVEETLRDADDLGLEERMEAADLIDRTVDEERSQLEAITRQQQALQAEEDAIEDSVTALEEQLEETEPGSPERRAIENQITEQRSRQQDIQEEQAELQQVDTEQRQAAITRADERASEIRSSVADDVASVSSQPVVSPLIITRGRISGANFFATIVSINANGTNVLMSAEQEIVGRNYLLTRNGLIAISAVSGTPHLVRFNSSDLSLLSEGETEISTYSPIIIGSGGDIYAVMKDGSEWYAGRFDTNLNTLFRSTIPVAEESDLVIEDGRLFVQRKDGRFSGLDLDDLRVSP